jgi:hypothetical protein
MIHERTRLVLVDVKLLAAQIIEDAAAEDPRLEIVAHFSKPISLVAAVERTDAQFVITGSRDRHLAEVGPLLRARPHVKVLAVDEEERHMFLYELRPHERALRKLGELSHRRLLEAIRAAIEEDSFEMVTS